MQQYAKRIEKLKNKSEKWIIDTSTIIHSNLETLNRLCMTVQVLISNNTVSEGKSGVLTQKMNYLIQSENVTVTYANKSGLRRVKQLENTIRSGDTLSKIDKEILAIGYTEDAGILTEDYMIQNYARHLSLPAVSLNTRGIIRKRKYYWTCIGCRKRAPDNIASVKDATCTTCGSNFKRKLR